MSTSWPCPLWKVTIKLLAIFPKLGHMIWGHEPVVPTLPGKAIKLSFPASPRTLSLRFDSTPVYREAELSTTNQGPDASVVVQWLRLCLTLCDPMDCSTPAFPVLHYLPECAQTHVHWVNDAIQPSHPPSLPSLFALNLSLHQSLYSKLAFHIRWPKYWSFSFSISPSSEYSGLISFQMDWLELLAVQGTLKSLLQHHSLKASIVWFSAFFMVQLSHPCSVVPPTPTPPTSLLLVIKRF